MAKVGKKTYRRNTRKQTKIKGRSKISKRSTKRKTSKRKTSNRNTYKRKTTKRKTSKRGTRRMRGGALRAGEVVIYPRTTTGKKITLNVLLTDTILSVKQKLNATEGIPVDQINLHEVIKTNWFGTPTLWGRAFMDTKTLSDEGITKGDIIAIIPAGTTPPIDYFLNPAAKLKID